MNTIQSNSAAVRGIVSSRNETIMSGFPRPQRHSPDHALMYAWSIGTTRAAQDRAVERPAPVHEECPPEVYIG
jgi:class 3 adenylate cyclase